MSRISREKRTAISPFPLVVHTDRRVPPAAKVRAEQIVLRVARVSRRPVLYGRVVLRVESDPAVERPAIAKATLDVNGRVLHAHAAASRIYDAIDVLDERLRRALEELEDRLGAERLRREGRARGS